MNDAVERFCEDLVDSGVKAHRIAELASRYQIALASASESEWDEFYRATHAALWELTANPAARSGAALESLLLIVADDRGIELFGSKAASDLRDALHGVLA